MGFLYLNYGCIFLGIAGDRSAMVPALRKTQHLCQQSQREM